MNKNELQNILIMHKEWLENNDNGIRADLSKANLSGADLYGADLSGANLHRTDLSEANLSEANLHRTDLSGANLHRTDLSEANLSEANLSGITLYNTKIDILIINSVYTIIVIDKNNIKIGCTNLSIEEWKEKGICIANKNNLDNNKIDKLKKDFILIEKWLEINEK